jgi:hypothetical protein
MCDNQEKVMKYSKIAMTLGVTMSLAAIPQWAGAEALTFCAENCKNIKIFNNAAVVVTKVRVKQQAGPNNCEAVEKVRSANLLKTESFQVSANPNCPYYVKYVTTDGCTGDKDGKISLDDFKDQRTQLYLDNYCGTLRVNNTQARRNAD